MQHVRPSWLLLGELSGLFHEVHQSGEHGDVTLLKTHLLDLRHTTAQSSVRENSQKSDDADVCNRTWKQLVCMFQTPPTCSPRYSTSSASCSRILLSSVGPPFAPAEEVALAPFLACFNRFKLSSIFLTELSTSDMVS